MPKQFAPGIPRKDYLGNIEKIQKGQVLDYLVQMHDAKRRGLHYDLRIGNKSMGMFSWALPSPPPALEGDRTSAARTNLHSHDYNTFEGTIPSGYGAGSVKKYDDGKVLITRTTPNTISFTIAGKHPERYTLVYPGPQYGEKVWHLVKQKTPESAGAEKQSYRTISDKEVLEQLKKLPTGSVVQPKLDGALQFVNFTNKKVEMLSHRHSKTTGKPVIHTERFFGERPHLDLPKELRNSVLLAEVYATKDGVPLPPQETSGLLNSTIENTLKAKEDKGVDFKAMLFGVAKIKGKPVNWDTHSYEERKELLKKFLEYLPKDKFHLPEEARTPEDAIELWKRIHTKQHKDTDEGVVIYPEKGLPTKAKLFPETDIYIRGIFPGEGKYEGIGAGGFTYSHTPKGPIVGRVGTGLDDDMRKLLFNKPDDYIGRIARVHSQGRHEKSQALRAPAFIALHEDYGPLDKPIAKKK